MTRKGLRILSLTLALGSSVGSASAQPASLEIGTAFCERETFHLADVSEVMPWFDYLAGLRTGLFPAPSLDCPSATVQGLYEVLTSPSLEEAVPRRDAFLARYIERGAAAEGEDARYLNDAEFASFVWLFCSGPERPACMEEIATAQPDDYLRTSPVFCDFASDREGVDWPSRSDLPLLCSREADDGATERWHADVDRWLFE